MVVPLQLSTMLKYVLLPYLCLFIGVHCEDQDEFMKSYFRSPVPLPKDYFIAAEKSPGQKSFAVLHYKHQQHHLEVQLYILNDVSAAESRTCGLNLTAKRGEAQSVGVSAFHRLANEKLAFTWYDEVTSHYEKTIERLYNVEAVDMKDCRRIYLDVHDVAENPIVVASLKSEYLDVILNDEDRCKTFGTRCRINYNLARNNIGHRHPFDIKYDWQSMEIKRLRDRDLLVFGRHGETFKATRYVLTMDKSSNAFLQIYGKANMEVVGNGLSYCWNIAPGTSLTVKCLQFNERMDNYLLQQDVELYEDVHLLDAHAIERGEILLVTKKHYCTDEDDCWQLSLMKVKAGESRPEMIRVSFPCTGDQKKLVIFSSLLNLETQKVDIHYACRNDNGYTFSYLEV